MKIFYDNIETAKLFLGSESIEPNEVLQDSYLVNEKIFKSKPYFKLSSNFSDYWKNLFIEQHSVESQFDTVCNLVSENYDLPANLVCLAETGDGFHGFRNRLWETKKGNLHLTIYFQPLNNTENFHAGLLLLAAVSVINTIDSVPSLRNRAQTKWVNDIVLGDSKVCGIIIKSFSTGNKVSGAVIGLGLNVLSSPQIEGDIFTTSTTSISEYSLNEEIRISKILQNLLNNLHTSIEILNSGKYDELLKIYIERSCVIGKKVAIYSDSQDGTNTWITEGIVKNIDKNLCLILKNHTEPVRKGRLAIIE